MAASRVDSCEILWGLEDCFGIRLNAAEFRGIETAGQIAELIARKVTLLPEAALDCPTALLFREFQSKVGEAFHISPDEIRPRSSTRDFLRLCQPQKAWNRLAKAIGVRLAPLQYPEGLFLLALPLALAALILPVIICVTDVESPNLHAGIAAIILSTGAFFLIERTLRPTLFWSLPPHLHTVDGFAYLMLRERKKKETGWTRGEIWALVQLVLADAIHSSPRGICKDNGLNDLASA